jgi:hypothetical protein
MPGDRLSPVGRAAREELLYFLGEMGPQLHVLLGPVYSVTLAAADPGVLVGQALLLGKFEGGFLDEDALSSMISRSPVPWHSAQDQSLTGWTTTSSDGVTGGCTVLSLAGLTQVRVTL